jgi:hypothetical protein
VGLKNGRSGGAIASRRSNPWTVANRVVNPAPATRRALDTPAAAV